MIEEVFRNIHRIEVPLPGSPLKGLNSYVLNRGDRFLIVDTGWDRNECLAAMLSGLEELNVELDRTDILVTHFHADHYGLAEALIRSKNKVYIGEKDASLANTSGEDRRNNVSGTFLSHGFPAPELQVAMKNHPGRRYGASIPVLTPFKSGDSFEFSGGVFTCIETPGHSPGHMCLYDCQNKILLSGDHILFDITPNITCWAEMENSLEQYLLSLQKIYDLDIKLILPAHRSIMNDHRSRISELIAHHGMRLEETLVALEKGEKTAWEVAPHLSWDIDCRSWEAFPPIQKWFAMGETIAHLSYLRACGDITSREVFGRVRFSLR